MPNFNAMRSIDVSHMFERISMNLLHNRDPGIDIWLRTYVDGGRFNPPQPIVMNNVIEPANEDIDDDHVDVIPARRDREAPEGPMSDEDEPDLNEVSWIIQTANHSQVPPPPPVPRQSAYLIIGMFVYSPILFGHETFFVGLRLLIGACRYVSDAVPAVLVSLSLFMFPKERPAIFCSRRKGNNERYVSSPSILQWSSLSRKFPWGVLLLLGGGFALAEATQVSGLSTVIADQLMVIGSFPPWAACIIVVLVTSVTTEITSNTVIATLLLPILAQVAVSMNIHPIYFMLPSTVAASFAFMLPVATPPNAIVFAHGDVKVVDMIKTGVALNVICIAVVTLAINTFGTAYFHLDHFPDWAAQLAPVTPATLQNVTSALLNGSTPLMNMHESSATPSLATNFTVLY